MSLRNDYLSRIEEQLKRIADATERLANILEGDRQARSSESGDAPPTQPNTPESSSYRSGIRLIDI